MSVQPAILLELKASEIMELQDMELQDMEPQIQLERQELE
jgi:hypothetical protein